VDREGRRSKLNEEYVCKLFSRRVQPSVEQVSELVFRSSILRHSVQDVLLDLLYRNLTFKRLLFSPECLFDAFSNLNHVDDFGFDDIAQRSCNSRLAGQRSARQKAPVDLLA
jgi:hypothetical protein